MSKVQNCTRPVLRYYGGKWRLSTWIISNFPRHKVYVEPFCGAASVLLRKKKSSVEILNDRYDRIVSLFRVIRDPESARQLKKLIQMTPYSYSEYYLARERHEDPIEDARRMIILGQQAHGSTGASGGKLSGWRRGINNGESPTASSWSEIWRQVPRWSSRLRGVFIENNDAFEVISRYDSEETLFYVDPPYIENSRNIQFGYAYEMTDYDHERLSEALHSVKGKVILSGYETNIYSNLYSDWFHISRSTIADKRRAATEFLWMNFDPDLEYSIRRNIQEGSTKTHQKRVSGTENKIKMAIKKLHSRQEKVTKTAVAELVGISREQISRRYSHLFL